MNAALAGVVFADDEKEAAAAAAVAAAAAAAEEAAAAAREEAARTGLALVDRGMTAASDLAAGSRGCSTRSAR